MCYVQFTITGMYIYMHRESFSNAMVMVCLQWSGLKRELPANVHLLTLEEFSADSYLLRLEHFYEKGEDAKLSLDATVSLKVSALSQ